MKTNITLISGNVIKLTKSTDNTTTQVIFHINLTFLNFYSTS